MASARGGFGGAAFGRAGSAALGSGCGYGDDRRAAGAADLVSGRAASATSGLPRRRQERSAATQAVGILPPGSGGESVVQSLVHRVRLILDLGLVNLSNNSITARHLHMKNASSAWELDEAGESGGRGARVFFT
uniref:Uncharacterized protein n=1 Tax=Oryza sativa subsp. japonica TaxID=39947 RepID=Q84QT2_ORYSJ|nr:hypothetical protein [Oryza sativa Japonica Group]